MLWTDDLLYVVGKFVQDAEQYWPHAYDVTAYATDGTKQWAKTFTGPTQILACTDGAVWLMQSKGVAHTWGYCYQYQNEGKDELGRNLDWETMSIASIGKATSTKTS